MESKPGITDKEYIDNQIKWVMRFNSEQIRNSENNLKLALNSSNQMRTWLIAIIAVLVAAGSAILFGMR